jgi:hypothetical protein
MTAEAPPASTGGGANANGKGNQRRGYALQDKGFTRVPYSVLASNTAGYTPDPFH